MTLNQPPGLGGGPDHGISWTIDTRASEIANGDVLFSPFVAAGWSGKVEHNLRTYVHD